MSARIAPEPIGTSIPPTTPEFRPRTALADAIPNDPVGDTPATSGEGYTPRMPDGPPPLPFPPDPPGAMFAAAVMAGALSPKPETPEEVFLRLGSSWQPPESDLHLADRKI